MKFFWAKKKHICLHCRTEIEIGEPFVRLGIVGRSGGQVGLLFHISCYPKWVEKNFVERFLAWRNSQIPPKKRGRPMVPCSDRPKRRRLLSLLIYHRERGHTARVDEIWKEIEKLEYRP